MGGRDWDAVECSCCRGLAHLQRRHVPDGGQVSLLEEGAVEKAQGGEARAPAGQVRQEGPGDAEGALEGQGLERRAPREGGEVQVIEAAAGALGPGENHR